MKKRILIILMIIIGFTIVFTAGCDEDDCDPETENCDDEWGLYGDDDDDNDDDDYYWDDDDDYDCTPVPATCNTVSELSGEITIKLTINSENTSPVVKLYLGDSVENGILVSEDTVTVSSITYTDLDANGSYSAKTEYRYGADTIVAIDGVTLDVESEDYCDQYGNTVTCYTVDDAELNLRFDKAAFKKYKNGETDHCFIATAAYGSLWAEEVTALRKFRDKYLMSSIEGRGLICLYYTVSPPLARYIKQSEVRKAIARALLNPVVNAVKNIQD